MTTTEGIRKQLNEIDAVLLVEKDGAILDEIQNDLSRIDNILRRLNARIGNGSDSLQGAEQEPKGSAEVETINALKGFSKETGGEARLSLDDSEGYKIVISVTPPKKD